MLFWQHLAFDPGVAGIDGRPHILIQELEVDRAFLVSLEAEEAPDVPLAWPVTTAFDS